MLYVLRLLIKLISELNNNKEIIMPFISFNFHKNLYYPLLFSFVSLFKHSSTCTFNIIINGSFYSLLFSSFALLVSLIPYFMSNKSKPDTIPVRNILQVNPIKQIQAKHYNNYLHYTLLITIGLLSAIIQVIQAELISFIFTLNSILSMLSIVITVILCYFIFKTSIYCHMIVALTMIFIITISMTLALIFYFPYDYSTINFFIGIVLLIICEPVREVLEKLLMERHFISLFWILSIEGLIGIGIALGFFGLQWVFKFDFVFCMAVINKGNQLSIFELMTYSQIINYVLFIILSYIASLFRVKSNEVFHPAQRYVFDGIHFCLMFLCFNICAFAYDILGGEEKQFLRQAFMICLMDIEKYSRSNAEIMTLMVICGFIFMFLWLFSVALLNEIVVLGICGMERNTRKEIQQRVEDERKSDQLDIEKYYSHDDMME